MKTASVQRAASSNISIPSHVPTIATTLFVLFSVCFITLDFETNATLFAQLVIVELFPVNIQQNVFW